MCVCCLERGFFLTSHTKPDMLMTVILLAKHWYELYNSTQFPLSTQNKVQCPSSLAEDRVKNETSVSLTGSLIYSVIFETSCSLFSVVAGQTPEALLSPSHLLQLSDPSSLFSLALRSGSLPFSLWIVYHELFLFFLSAIP